MAGTNGVSPKRETSQAKRLTALEEAVTALETKVGLLEKMTAKLFAAVAGPQLQQHAEQQFLVAMQRGEAVEQTLAPPQQFS